MKKGVQSQSAAAVVAASDKIAACSWSSFTPTQTYTQTYSHNHTPKNHTALSAHSSPELRVVDQLGHVRGKELWRAIHNLSLAGHLFLLLLTKRTACGQLCVVGG